MSNPLQDLQQLGQSVWYDNIARGLIVSGSLKELIDLGVSGLTSNPTIFEKAIAGGADYDDALSGLAAEGRTAEEIFEALTIEDIRAAADLLRPAYDRADGADGYASLEVSPHLAHDTEGTLAEARRLFTALDRPNVMIKVPGTPEGVPAMRQLISEGININNTLIFSLEAYRSVRSGYIDGLRELARAGGDVGRVASVASFFVSRVDTVVDGKLDAEAHADLVGKAAIANAKVAYADFRKDFDGESFEDLRDRGARVQRPLWASTSTKNPDYPDVYYAEALVGPDTVDTMPEATLRAFADHGKASLTLERGLDDARKTLESLAEAGVDMDEVTANLLADGVKQFADSYNAALANVEEKRAALRA
jgi:transaldolase